MEGILFLLTGESGRVIFVSSSSSGSLSERTAY